MTPMPYNGMYSMCGRDKLLCDFLFLLWDGLLLLQMGECAVFDIFV